MALLVNVCLMCAPIARGGVKAILELFEISEGYVLFNFEFSETVIVNIGTQGVQELFFL